MYRLGCFTGRIYDKSVDASTIEECCLLLNSTDRPSDDDPTIIEERIHLRKKCSRCMSCPEAQRSQISLK